jgi:anti-anti-sigma factor
MEMGTANGAPGQPDNNCQPSSDALTIKKMVCQNQCLMTISGELKHGQSEIVFDEAVQIFGSGSSELVIDLRPLNYCDTSGLQSIVRIYKYVRNDPSLKFTLLIKAGDLADVLHTCRFDQFIDISFDPSIISAEWKTI